MMIGPPVLAVVALAAITVSSLKLELDDINHQADGLATSQQIINLVLALQRERGMTCVFLTTLAHSDDKLDGLIVIENQLASLREGTNGAISELKNWNFLSSRAKGATQYTNGEFYQYYLDSYRKGVGNVTTECFDNIKFYTDMILMYIDMSKDVMYETASGPFWSNVAAMSQLLHAQDLYGIKRATGSSFFASQHFDSEMYRYFVEISGSADRFFDRVKHSTQSVALLIEQQFTEHNQTAQYLYKMDGQIYANDNQTRVVDEGENGSIIYFSNMTKFMAFSTVAVQKFISSELVRSLGERMAQKKMMFWVSSVIVGLALVICPAVTIYFGIQSHQLRKKVAEKLKDLAEEKRKTDMLLCQMVPRSIVGALKNGRDIITDSFSSVTVFFSDIKGFTILSSVSSPLQVVNLLNSLYSSMDSILDRYDCYKVETIGDAYMVASGVPKANGSGHSQQICTMALDMLREVVTVPIPHMPTEQLLMRIGIHTGPVAAGVVGNKMPRYCLFGDTVNTASRMESTSEAMCIQVSDATRTHVTEHFRDMFTFEVRGEIEVKGKGSFLTHWLLGKKDFPYTVNLSAAQSMEEKANYYNADADPMNLSRENPPSATHDLRFEEL